VGGILQADQKTLAGLEEQRLRVKKLKDLLAKDASPEAKELLQIADYLVKKSVWVMGGDGWAYDIGYGGLDHVLATGRNVNVLVLDTEVYSNTGGQMSKSTPLGAVAKFAAAGKTMPKKDMGLIAMTYGNIYVARVAMGANDAQTLKAFVEAESYDGPSLILAYSHCIAHGYDLVNGLKQQKAAVQSGQWLLYRYDPRLALQGKNPLQLDSQEPSLPLEEYMNKENRFKILMKSKPEEAKRLLEEEMKLIKSRYNYYKLLASPAFVPGGANGGSVSAPAAPQG
jgi:pyruvate-ferredoxin/flavodoxin oxidoreductase